jgi:FkbM family methyltransferase
MAVVPDARPPAAAGPPGPEAFAWTERLRERRRETGAAPISAIVHTRNEERFVATALASLGWVDEVVVVDMESEDATVSIAESMGARVEPFENVGYVEPARRFGIAQATHDWVLLLDADEWIEEPLAESLSELATSDAADVVDLPFKSFICGDWLRGTGWAGEYHPRFFRIGFVDWPAHVHAVPELSGRVLKLDRAPGLEVCHWNYDDLHEFVDKLNRYTTREAERLDTHSWRAATAAAREEVEYRWTPEVDGTRSVALSLAMVCYRLIAHAKAWELAGFPDVGAPATAAEALRSLALPGHAEALDAYAAGDLDGAAGLLRGAVAADVLNDLAVVEAARGRTDVAELLLQACLAVEPGNDDALANFAALAPPVPDVIASAGPELVTRLTALTGLSAAEVEQLYRPGAERAVYVPAAGGAITVRPGTSDIRVLDDTFVSLYHVPPAEVEAPRLVVDLGSNIGTTVAHFAQLWPDATIVGVELDPENARLARANVARFGERCTIVQAAIAAADGELRYTPSPGEEWGYRAGAAGTSVVPALSLETLVAGLPCDVDYLKVDVEGAEAEVFRTGGDWANHVRVLKCEVHPPYTVDEARADLERLGFVVETDTHHFSCVIARRP